MVKLILGHLLNSLLSLWLVSVLVFFTLVYAPSDALFMYWEIARRHERCVRSSVSTSQSLSGTGFG